MMTKTKYTQEHIDWLRKNANDYYIKELTIKFNENFNMNNSKDAISYLLKKHNIEKKIHNKLENLKPCVQQTFNEEQKEWIMQQDKSLTFSEACKKYNSHWNTNIPTAKFRRVCKNLKIYFNLTIVQYTDEELKWLRINRSKYKERDLTELFNKKFNRNISHRTLNGMMSKYGILKGSKKPAYILSNEQKQWFIDNYKQHAHKNNYNKVMIEEFYKTFNYKLTQNQILYIFRDVLKIKKPNSYTSAELGHEKILQGVCWIKVKDEVPPKDSLGRITCSRFNYRRKSHVLYEKYHNVKINDEKQIVMHLDNNNNNFDKDNLYLVSRTTERIFISSRYKNETLDTRLNAIKVSEILALIKEK